MRRRRRRRKRSSHSKCRGLGPGKLGQRFSSDSGVDQQQGRRYVIFSSHAQANRCRRGPTQSSAPRAEHRRRQARARSDRMQPISRATGDAPKKKKGKEEEKSFHLSGCALAPPYVLSVSSSPFLFISLILPSSTPTHKRQKQLRPLPRLFLSLFLSFFSSLSLDWHVTKKKVFPTSC